MLSWDCAVLPEPSASPPLTCLPPPSTHTYPLAPHSPSPARPPQPPGPLLAMKADWGSSPVKVRVPSMLSWDHPLPQIKAHSLQSTRLCCLWWAREGFSPAAVCCRKGILHPTPPHCWAAIRVVPSSKLSWAFCLLPDTSDKSVPQGGLGALDEAMVEQGMVVWRETLQPISTCQDLPPLTVGELSCVPASKQLFFCLPLLQALYRYCFLRQSLEVSLISLTRFPSLPSRHKRRAEKGSACKQGCSQPGTPIGSTAEMRRLVDLHALRSATPVMVCRADMFGEQAEHQYGRQALLDGRCTHPRPHTWFVSELFPELAEYKGSIRPPREM